MAVSEVASTTTTTTQMVGNAFVEQYYSILHQDPDQVHRFYHDSSVLSRPEEDGTMTSVTTTAEIDKKIQSLDYTSFRVEVLSADAQPSYNNGVMVVVTGCLTGTDNVKRKFAQSFFLAPQDKGFYVLNDVFRYVDEYKSVDIESVPANDVVESAPSEAPEPEAVHVPEEIPPSQTVIADTETIISKEVTLPLENGKLPVVETVIPVNHVKETIHQELPPVTEKVASNTQEDTPKKSFASIVNALKDNSAPFHLRASPAKPAVQPPRVHSSVPAPEVQAPLNTDIPLERNNENSGKAHAIFVANLPMNATVEQLDRVFKKFGSIKRDGIQVRSNKGSCFGFVEFESAASLQSALEASPPVMLDNRRLSIEERRANNDRVRYSSGRSGYRNDRNDGFRGRGNFGGGRGGGGGGSFNGRNEFEKRGDFSGRPRGGNNNNNNNNNNGRINGDVVPRSYQNGGKAPRQQAPVKVQ